MANWTVFTNHGHILFLLALKPKIAVKEIASEVGITERAALRILSELSRDNFINVTKQGRCNSYSINSEMHLRHDIEKSCKVEDILKVIKKSNHTYQTA